MEEHKPTFDGWTFIVAIGVVLFAYLIGKAIYEGVRDVIASHPEVVMVIGVVAVCGILITAWFISQSFITGHRVTDIEIVTKEVSSGYNFERNITIRTESSVTAKSDYIEYRLTTERKCYVVLVTVNIEFTEVLEWDPRAIGPNAESVVSTTRHQTIRVIDFKDRVLTMNELNMMLNAQYNRVIETPSPTPEGAV